MSAVELLQPILDADLQRNNFFNGRLLSAEDLRAEQDANRAEHAHLTRAIGDGIAWGLRVSALSLSPARVKVTRGLALNRLGDQLSLSADAEVTLIAADKIVVDGATGVFANCEPLVTTSTVASGAYVLVVSPASGYRGTAVVSDPNTTALGRGACGPRFTVEGVRFRLIALTFDDFSGIGNTLGARIGALMPPDSAAKTERLRNLLAHACFGSVALRNYFSDQLEPVGDIATPAGWGALDALRYRGDITDCDVPLAIAVLKPDRSLALIDMWSARRKLVDAAAIASWRAVAGPRRGAEGEAAFLQFQAQLDIVKGIEAPANVAATKYFDYLPAAGWLPIGSGGFNWSTFLGAHAPPEVTPVDAALLRGIAERSWYDESFALDTSPPVPLRVYRVDNQGFVVFARSACGNIRVTLSPAPDSNVSVDVAATAKTGPVRRGTTRSGAVVPIVGAEPGLTTVSASVPGFVPNASATVNVIGGRTVDVAVTLTPLPNGSILVTAVDIGNINLSGVTIVATGGGQTRSSTAVGEGLYRIADLPPAVTFSLEGTAAGYKKSTKGPIGPIAAGEEKTVILVFEEPGRTPKTQPSKCVYVAKINRPALQKVRLCMVTAATEFEEAYYYGQAIKTTEKRGRSGAEYSVPQRAGTWTKGKDRYSSYTGQIVYSVQPWSKMVTLDPESPDVNKWLAEWADWLAFEFEDERIKGSRPIVKLDPRYTIPTKGSEVPSKPPAYAVFGDFGVPLAIQPEHGLTPVPVPNGKEYFPWERKDWFDRLCQYALCWVDDIPWIWDEFMIDVTGDPRDLVRDIMGDAMEKVKKIIEDRSYLPGVDKDVNDRLKAGGYGDNVIIANGDVEVLKDMVGGRAAAKKLILEARSITPQESWSLDKLNMSDEQTRVLGERGVMSLGDLNRYATGNRVELEKILGVDGQSQAARDAAIGELTGNAFSGMAQGSVEVGSKGTVAELPGASGSTAARLTESGLGTIEVLAGATKEEVSAATNLPTADAQKLIDSAAAASRNGVTVDKVAGVTAQEATALNKLVGATGGQQATVGQVLAKSTEAIAKALNPAAPDMTRATALVNGLQSGVKSTREITSGRQLRAGVTTGAAAGALRGVAGSGVAGVGGIPGTGGAGGII